MSVTPRELAKFLACWLAENGAKEVVLNVMKDGQHHRISVIYEHVGPAPEDPPSGPPGNPPDTGPVEDG